MASSSAFSSAGVLVFSATTLEAVSMLAELIAKTDETRNLKSPPLTRQVEPEPAFGGSDPVVSSTGAGAAPSSSENLS